MLTAKIIIFLVYSFGLLMLGYLLGRPEENDSEKVYNCPVCKDTGVRKYQNEPCDHCDN